MTDYEKLSIHLLSNIATGITLLVGRAMGQLHEDQAVHAAEDHINQLDILMKEVQFVLDADSDSSTSTSSHG
jgi:hypothetical protein